MTDAASILVLVTGVLIGSSAAGVIAHTMNYISELDKGHQWGILSGYIIVLTFGLTAQYERPLIILVTSFLGIVVIGGWIFNQVKGRLPSKITLREE